MGWAAGQKAPGTPVSDSTLHIFMPSFHVRAGGETQAVMLAWKTLSPTSSQPPDLKLFF